MTEPMAVETTKTFPGINADILAGFANFASENPDDVLLGAMAKTTWTGHAGHSNGKIGPWAMAGNMITKPAREYTLQFGAWKEVEEAIGVQGADDKLEPVECALAAMCSCVTWAICISAAREGITFDHLEVSASTDIDPRVLVGSKSTDESASLVSNVRLAIEVRGEGLTRSDLERIEDMANRSPVHAMITYANPMKTTVSLV